MFLQNTSEMNGGGEALARSATSRLPIVADGGETGHGVPLSTPVVPLQNGAHSSTSSLTPAQHQSKSSLSDKTTLSRSTATNGGGVKKSTRADMQENVDSTNGSQVSISNFFSLPLDLVCPVFTM